MLRIHAGKAQFQALTNPLYRLIQIWKRKSAMFCGAIVLLFLMLPLLSQAQAASPSPRATLTTDQVVAQLVQQNQRRAALLKHYQSCRFYSVDYVGFPGNKSASMVVDMAYDAPAQKQFRTVKEQGSKLLIDHVLHELIHNEKEATNQANLGRTELTPSNYEFQLVGTENIAGKLQYVLQVAPRLNNKFLYNGKIWVDAEEFAVTRVAAHPAKNISFWISNTDIDHEYQKLGEFWLPVRNTSITKVRFGGTAKLKIEYRDYHIGEVATHADACSQAAAQAELPQGR
jgi:hypothetical protein